MRKATIAVGVAVVVWAGLAVLIVSSIHHGSDLKAETTPTVDVQVQTALGPPPATAVPPPTEARETPKVSIRFHRNPKAGMLVDLHTGEPLWQRNPTWKLPIASLTKMMTALLIAERDEPDERANVTRAALAYEGSGLGVLPKGKSVTVGALLTGLLLVSANDAAILLAQHDSGSVEAFVRRMNRRARSMGLDCTHFTSPNGYVDRGNYSCARDLALLARADLANPTVRRLAKTDHARVHFPIKGGTLELFNNNPFVGQPGITGLKTGLTAAAGRCYVITAREGKHALGVILLNSPNPIAQVHRLLRAGFKAEAGGGA
jgi:D-alanyl-D-alanine carboxypeptidase